MVQEKKYIEEIYLDTECLQLIDAYGFIINHHKVETRLTSVNHDDVETRFTKDKSICEFHLYSNKTVLLTGKNDHVSIKQLWLVTALQ